MKYGIEDNCDYVYTSACMYKKEIFWIFNNIWCDFMFKMAIKSEGVTGCITYYSLRSNDQLKSFYQIHHYGLLAFTHYSLMLRSIMIYLRSLLLWSISNHIKLPSLRLIIHHIYIIYWGRLLITYNLLLLWLITKHIYVTIIVITWIH